MESSPNHRSRCEPVQARGLKTRRLVLQAARRIFVLRGYEFARVDEITKLAQVGYGTFYKYFRDKQDVLDTVLEELYSQLSEGVFPEHIDTSNLERQIRQALDRFLQACHKNRDIILALQPARSASPRVCGFLAERRDREVQWMVRELESIRSRGWQIQGSLEVLSRALIQMAENVAQDWIANRRHLRLEEVRETICLALYGALLAGRPDLIRS